MQHPKFWMPLAVLMAAGASTTTHAYSSYSVYSAAGELPGQRMERLAEERAIAEAQRLQDRAAEEAAMERERLLAAAPPLPQQSAPPLPQGNIAGSSPPPLPSPQVAQAAPSAAAQPPSSAGTRAAPANIPAMVERDFHLATSDDVTIDVIDMPLEKVVTNLAPTGWKIRFQRVGDELLSSSIDLTATNTSRGEVLHTLLSRAGLAAEPFPEFDQPLLIVSRQGEL